MRALALDPITGDLAIRAGRLTLVNGVDAVRQKLELRLSIWQGEWFADRGIGVPFLAFLGVKGAQPLAEATFKRAILTCPGVVALDRFAFALNARRRAVLTFRARATEGQPIEVKDFVAGAA